MAAPSNNNTLTNLIPDAYAALDVVSRELTGFIPTVSRDPRADRTAVGQTLRSSVAPVNSAGSDITPAMTLPSAANQTIGNKSLTITKSRFFPFSWSGEDSFAVDQGPGFLTIKQDQIAQALRAAVNEIELDLGRAIALGGSRAINVAAAATLVQSNFSAARKILDDNGAPQSDRHVVLNTTSGAAMRNIANLYKANEAGEESLLRQGVLTNLYGFDIRESAQVDGTAAGTNNGSATTDSAGYAIGDTVITLASAGTGTIVAGDIITFSTDTSVKYVVAVGDNNVANGGTITLAAPGLRFAITAAPATIVTIGTSAKCAAYSRNAVLLATRLPLVPEGGDLAIDRETITDPRTGLSFEIAMYPGYRMVTYHVSVAWGTLAVKPEHIAIIPTAV